MDSTSDPHPLRRSTSSSTTKTARQDTGSTRPRLSRVLTPSTPNLSRPNPPTDRAEAHRAVVVHEVSPSDSLAGVALKYGISVTELRRANQLWASDSIHLRQVLYVPLDKARHSDGEEDTARPAGAASSHTRSDPDADSSTNRPSVVRRIPLTSLSFFPPPSSSSSAVAGGLPSGPSSSHFPPPAASTAKGPNLTSTLRSTALSSFFSVLPINASTRDEIFSRLSIDSASNSTTGSDEAEHELTDVPTTPKRKPLSTDDTAPVSMPATTLTNSRRKNRPRHAWLSESRNGEEGHEPYTQNVEQIPLASSPIHTTQMQPAPAMQLPGSMMRSGAPKENAPLADSLNGALRPSDHHPQTR
ncbi:hypothetical protein EI94DRAFT_1700104 [Lactarius quietus]|nr:hypothetical protein EI94DRAFT_1700104 [Lactarius quietus]